MTVLRQETGRLTELADPMYETKEARDRASRSLVQDVGPSTASSSDKWIDWGGAAELLGQPFDTVSIPLSKLEQMRRDPMIAFGLAFVKLPLIRAPWYIKSEDGQRAAFVDNALRRIYGRLVLAWCNSLDYGFSGIVKRFEYDKPTWTYIDKDQPDEPEKKVWDSSAKALVWKPFLALNPRYIYPAWNDDGDFDGIHYRKSTSSEGTPGSRFPFESGNRPKNPDIPLDRALWATNEKDSVFGSLWGYPRTGYAYRYWWAYWYRFGWADRAYEKWADPPVEVYHPTDIGIAPDGAKVDYTQEALKLAESIRSGANVALPSDIIIAMDGRMTNVRQWEIRQQESKANFDALNQAFEYLDVQKLRSLMVPEQALMEGKGGSSSRNVASEFGDLLQESQAMVMEEIDDAINRYLIPQLLEVNFGPGGPACTKVTTGFDPQDIETIRSIIGGIANAQPGKLPVDLREMLDRLGIPVLSSARIQAELEEAAKAAAENPPPETAAQPGAAAGVTEAGFYYSPPERIQLREKPYAVKRVTELPVDHDGAVAYFDEVERTLFVLEDAPVESWAEFLRGLAKKGPIVLDERDGEVASVLLEASEVDADDKVTEDE